MGHHLKIVYVGPDELWWLHVEITGYSAIDSLPHATKINQSENLATPDQEEKSSYPYWFQGVLLTTFQSNWYMNELIVYKL